MHRTGRAGLPVAEGFPGVGVEKVRRACARVELPAGWEIAERLQQVPLSGWIRVGHRWTLAAGDPVDDASDHERRDTKEHDQVEDGSHSQRIQGAVKPAPLRSEFE